MKRIELDMIYLLSCGVNRITPDEKYLKEIDLENLYRMSCAHSVDALIGMVLKQAGVSLSKEWTEGIAKATRKILLFDMERAKLLSFMEERGIWYLPLKGVILKDYYPSLGMRQMSDNDILFDYSFSEEIRNYMESQGYKTMSFGKGTHDTYEKEPVYNFELHGALYKEAFQSEWAEYYSEIKKKLIQNSESSYGYHFTDEDFYVYILSHAYKHYDGGGTGIRTLLDFYVYLKEKHQSLNFTYIEQECVVLGIAEFEYQSRKLCEKVFAAEMLDKIEYLDEILSDEEKELLIYFFTSGVYGTIEQGVKNSVKKLREQNEGLSKIRYIWKRLFPDVKVMETYYLHIYKHKLFLPLGYMYRLWMGLFIKSRRNKMVKEVNVIKKIK